jgi:hypothetical protein
MTEPETKSLSLAQRALISLLSRLTEKGRQTLDVWDRLPQWLKGRVGPVDIEVALRFLIAEKNKISQRTGDDDDCSWLVQLVYSVSTVSALNAGLEAMLNEKAYLRDKKREKYNKSKKGIALNSAVDEALKTYPTAKPRKEFLRVVNKQLQTEGLTAVKVRAATTRAEEKIARIVTVAREIALGKAVEEELKASPSAMPWEEFLGAVNRRLIEQGFDEVETPEVLMRLPAKTSLS